MKRSLMSCVVLVSVAAVLLWSSWVIGAPEGGGSSEVGRYEHWVNDSAGVVIVLDTATGELWRVQVNSRRWTSLGSPGSVAADGAVGGEAGAE